MKQSELQNTSILIIDDEPRVAELISDILNEPGLSVHIVTHFDQVATALEQYSPAIVFLDMNLGTHSGMEVLDLMARANSEARIILMSGMDDSALEPGRDKAKRLQLNLEPNLGKPFEIEEVEACLQATLDKD